MSHVEGGSEETDGPGAAAGAPRLDLQEPRRIHVVGVGGSGMSAIAEALVGMGHHVSGSDLRASANLDRLSGLGVRVFVGHSAANLDAATPGAATLGAISPGTGAASPATDSPGTDSPGTGTPGTGAPGTDPVSPGTRTPATGTPGTGDIGGPIDAVAISTAVPPDNPEVVAARRMSVPVLARSAVLAAICAERRTIAVSGTHGKTTTSSLLAVGLVGAGMRPSFVVGGEIIGLGSGARWDDGEWLVVEADESDGTFLALPCEIAIVTSVEPDHLEHYGSFAVLEEAFDRFLGGASGNRLVCADDPGAAALGRRHGAVSYGTAAAADMRMVEVVGDRASVRFGLLEHGRPLGEVEVPLPGLHNARNAAGAVSAALLAGASFPAVVSAVAGSGGIGRRFQLRGERRGVTFVDDYAHLPGEVAAALAAARDGEWRRVVCVFQPHRYSRTAALWRDFGSSFADADLLLVTDVYAAGEQPRAGVSGRLIADAVLDLHPDAAVTYVPDRADLVARLRQLLSPGDLCLTLGAGDLTTLADELLTE